MREGILLMEWVPPWDVPERAVERDRFGTGSIREPDENCTIQEEYAGVVHIPSSLRFVKKRTQ